MHHPKNQLMTLVFPVRDGNVLLGMKKTSLGKGWWNGFGGKVEVNETVEVAAVRELEEESALIASVKDLHAFGVIDFYFTHTPKWNQQVHIFIVEKFIGTPVETREMQPQYFPLQELPYGKMWPADKYFVPRVLAGETITGEIHFTKSGYFGTLKSSTGEIIPFASD
jgi:ADP-ribose pyrophosphatase YjhB (NUDIX family)